MRSMASLVVVFAVEGYSRGDGNGAGRIRREGRLQGEGEETIVVSPSAAAEGIRWNTN